MNVRIPALLAAACLLPACDGSDIEVAIETPTSSSIAASSEATQSSNISSAASSNSAPSVSNSSTASLNPDDALKALSFSRSSWQRYNNGHYQYEYHQDCFCFGRDDFYVEWNNGAVVSRSPISDEDTPIVDNIDPSIDALFDIVEAAIMAGHLQEVAYHPQYGYPERAVIDPIPGAADTTTTYRIVNFGQTPVSVSSNNSLSNSSSSSSSHTFSSAPHTLSAEEIASRLAERDAAVDEWANHQDRSYQYSLGRFGDCTLVNVSCPDGYDYLYTTQAVVSNGEPVMGFEKGISQTIGQLIDRPQNLETRIDTSDGIVTNPYYTFSYSPEGVASWRYDYPAHLGGDYGGTDLLTLEFFDELEAERQAQAFFWEADKPAGDYSFTLNVDCNCGYDGSHRVTVAGGEITTAPLSASEALPANAPKSVADLFGLLADAYAKPSAFVQVTFNADMHYPETVTFNPELMRSEQNVTYSISDLSSHPALNLASKSLADWRRVSDLNYDYRFESKELSVNVYHYLITAVNGEHNIQQVFEQSDAAPIAANIDEVYQTFFAHSDARDLEFAADSMGVPTEVRIHPLNEVPGDYLRYSISNFQLLNITQDQLDSQRAKWQAANISNYTMTANLDCFCAIRGLLDIEVVDGAISHAYSQVLARDLSNDEVNSLAITVEMLFTALEQALANNQGAEASFDPALGYPTTVIVNREGQAADAGFTVQISNLQAAGEAHDFSDYQDLWASFTGGDYSYDYYTQCFCPGPHGLHIEVVNGEITKTTPLNEPTSSAEPIPPITINEIMAKLASAYDKGLHVTATFDSTYGFPIDSYIDPDPRIADEEMGYRIENFQWHGHN